MRRSLIAGLTLLLALFFAYQSFADDLKDAEGSVLRFFDQNEHFTFDRNLFHEDFTEPGGDEYTRYVIKNPVSIVGSRKVIGDYNIMNPHEEELIEVTAKAAQTFYIRGTSAERQPVERKLIFYFSNYKVDDRKYRILFVKAPHSGIYFVYEDDYRKILNADKGKRSIELRKQLASLGMQGLAR